jgi:hypothetical protein
VSWVREPITVSLEATIKAFHLAIEAGDYPYTSYASYHIMYFLFTLNPLEEFMTLSKPTLEYAKKGTSARMLILI